MADGIGTPGDDIGPDGITVPDVPQTALAFRTWRLSEGGRLLSINAPSLTGKAGGTATRQRKVAWIHRAMADEGQDGWPIGGPLVAHCGVSGSAAEANPDHGKIPAKQCSCGIYATTSMKVVNQYLGNENVQGVYVRGPVLGIVEMGGRVIPATQGFRAAYARIAGILLIDSAFSLAGPQLRAIAETYRVPLITPHSLDPEDYRADIAQLPPVSDPSAVADEVDAWLASMDPEDDDKNGGE